LRSGNCSIFCALQESDSSQQHDSSIPRNKLFDAKPFKAEKKLTLKIRSAIFFFKLLKKGAFEAENDL
jgi:hypothetical protein